jgi:hypothetical protein
MCFVDVVTILMNTYTNTVYTTLLYCTRTYKVVRVKHG